ncbi:hypothetical protein GCM10009535_00710 [Streptomyces thermocarboxydovorans]|uniref:L-lysine N6-monooxygenase MbtG n=1 Tax=Streptomyces thermocarboxydovorans TaxID=59298 RepID=A0ABN1H597_9ACTN
MSGMGHQAGEALVPVLAGLTVQRGAVECARTGERAEICSVFGKYGYTPADDSPFANRIFGPEAVEIFYRAPADVKRSLFDYHRSTNYSVADLELIESLSRTTYQEKVQGRQRLRMMNVSRIREVATLQDGVEVTMEYLPTGERETLPRDLLVCATGNRPRSLADNLGESAKLCLRDEEDQLRVGRDHRVETNANDVTADIYLQGGGTEHTHGVTSTLLSTTAVRSGEICASLLGRRRSAQPRATADLARG